MSLFIRTQLSISTSQLYDRQHANIIVDVRHSPTQLSTPRYEQSGLPGTISYGK